MEKNATLVIDVGTSSIRGVLCDDFGKHIKIVQHKYDLELLPNNYVELNPKILLDFMVDICTQIGSFAKSNDYNLESISITSQRSSVICIGEQGDALMNAIMWQDKRTALVCDELQPLKDEIFYITGLNISPVFSLPKIKWVKENMPEIFTKTYKFAGFLEYLVFHLTGHFTVDTSTASRSAMFDITNKVWSDKILDKMGISKENLCEVIDVGTSKYNTTKEFSRILQIENDIPVILAGGDQQCASLGLGCIENSDIMVNCGTGAFCICIVDEPFFSKEDGLSCNVSAIKDKWIVEGSVICAGTALDWSKDKFLDVEISEVCEKSGVGANGVIANSQFAGKGTPTWDSYARGSFNNISISNTKYDMVRAVLESIVEEIANSVFSMMKMSKNENTHIICSGGISKLKAFNQMQADIYNNKLNVSQNDQATVTGAWISAMVFLGKYKTHKEAFEKNQYEFETYEPISENVEIYNKIRNVRNLYNNDYKKIFDLLK
ncbi:MAG: FGGY-family carbohydrate kinase [Clostridia bacterium]